MNIARSVTVLAAMCCLGFTAHASGQCAGAAGDCCTANGSAGCNDETCCNSVCAQDPFCCDTEWDEACAATAAADPNCPCGSGTPPNDDCADAIPVEDGAIPFSTENATDDGPPLTPDCDKGFGLGLGADIWYLYTAPCTDVATFSTCNTADYDTRFAAYTGDCNNLTQVACNDDGPGCAGFSSILEVDVVEGQTYLIRLGGFNGASGTGTLTVSCGGSGMEPPANDDCADALPITAGDTDFTNINATTDGPPLEPNCEKGFGLSLIDDVWYTYEAACDGTATFSTCNMATFDTRMAAYIGECGNLTQVACNDDGAGCTGFTSIMDVPVECGQTYLIRVGAFDGANPSGSGTINVSCTGEACPKEECPADLNGDGTVGPGDLAIILGNWGPCPGCPADLNGDGTVGPGDLAIALGTWGPCP